MSYFLCHVSFCVMSCVSFCVMSQFWCDVTVSVYCQFLCDVTCHSFLLKVLQNGCKFSFRPLEVRECFQWFRPWTATGLLTLPESHAPEYRNSACCSLCVFQFRNTVLMVVAADIGMAYLVDRTCQFLFGAGKLKSTH